MQARREGILRFLSFEMSNVTGDIVQTQFDRAEVDGRSVVVCKHCNRHLTGNKSAMRMHYRMKHSKPLADAPNQVDSPTSILVSDMAASSQVSDSPTSNALPPDHSQGSDVGAHKTTHSLAEKRVTDARRYLASCAASPLAFRRAIDSLPSSSIKRVYELVCNAAKGGDAEVKLSPKQRRLCTKYEADSRASLKTKRRLLRRANKEAVRSVFAPLMLQTAFGAADGGVMSATL
jgi:hypothetical protein